MGTTVAHMLSAAPGVIGTLVAAFFKNHFGFIGKERVERRSQKLQDELQTDLNDLQRQLSLE
jgi:hypothetical protein